MSEEGGGSGAPYRISAVAPAVQNWIAAEIDRAKKKLTATAVS
jgi:hypothetical protein